MAFPISPVNGQVSIVNNISYKYSSATTSWTRVSVANTLTNTLVIDSIVVTSLSASISTSTGALVVAGGVGVGGTLNATSATILKDLNVGGVAYSQGWALSTGSSAVTAIAGGSTGSVLIQTAPGVTGFVSVGTTGTILTSNGTTPYWTTPVSASGTATTVISEVSAGAGQTVFSIAGGYTLNQVQVFANGVQLSSGDFTASNGTSVTLTQPRRAGDIIRFVVGQLFNFSPQQAYLVNELTAVQAGQTTWATSYNAASVQVFLAGLLISPNSYTASNGTTITLSSTTAVTVTTGTKMDVYSFNSVSISGALSNSGGTINGNLNVIGNLQNNGLDFKATSIAIATAMGV